MNVREDMAILPAAPAGSGAGVCIGGSVVGPDGGHPIGIVDKVVLAPPTGEVTHLLIRCFGPLRHDVLMPMAGVAAVEGGVVRLSVPVAQLNRPADRDAATTTAPPAPWVGSHGYEPDQVLFTLPERAALPERGPTKISSGTRLKHSNPMMPPASCCWIWSLTRP